MRVDVRHHRLNVVGLSVDDFASAVGVSADVIRNVERTGNRPRPANAVTLAKYFDLTPDEMWGELEAVDQPSSSSGETRNAA